MLRGFKSEPNLNSIKAIYPWIACWGAAQHLNSRSRQKAEVREVMANIFR